MNTNSTFETVFHPTDFSKGDERAFYHALKIAMAAHGRFSLLHIEKPGDRVDWNAFPRVSPILEKWGCKVDLSGTDGKKPQIKVMKVRKSGKELKEILKFLENHSADLVVLSTHQRGGLTRMLHKAVAEPIARKSGRMTLFVPRRLKGFVSPENGSVSIKNVLIPIDRRPHPQQAVDATLELLNLLGCDDAKISFLHVNGNQEDIPAFRFPERNRVEYIFDKGPVIDVILKTANLVKADLIVMPTLGHQGFLDALRGSTTEQVLRKAKCPLFAVPQ